MAYNTEFADRFRLALLDMSLSPGEEIGEKKMFGGLCFTLNGKMLIGIEMERVMVRLGNEDYAREFEAGRVVPMDFTGRPLRNFAYVRIDTFKNDSDFLRWADMSATFVREKMLKDGKSKGGTR